MEREGDRPTISPEGGELDLEFGQVPYYSPPCPHGGSQVAQDIDRCIFKPNCQRKEARRNYVASYITLHLLYSYVHSYSVHMKQLHNDKKLTSVRLAGQNSDVSSQLQLTATAWPCIAIKLHTLYTYMGSLAYPRPLFPVYKRWGRTLAATSRLATLSAQRGAYNFLSISDVIRTSNQRPKRLGIFRIGDGPDPSSPPNIWEKVT